MVHTRYRAHHTDSRSAGGWSKLLRFILHKMFVGPSSFSSSGVAVRLGDNPVLLFAKLTNILGDELALNMGFDAKGASGTKPYMICRNVVMKGSDLAHRRAGYLLEITSPEVERFDVATDADMYEAMGILSRAQPGWTKTAFKQLQQSIGYNFNPDGVLADSGLVPHVRPSSCLTYDSMHCLLSNGVLSLEVFLLLDVCEKHFHLKYPAIQLYFKSDWRFPGFSKCKGRAIHEVFNSTRESASKHSFKASATELLIVYPILRHFMDTVITPRCVPSGSLRAEVRSFAAACRIVDLLQAAKAGNVDHEGLRMVAAEHLKLFVTAYGEEYVLPKHHFTQHLARQLLRDSFVLDAFTVERKHREVLQCAQNTDNTKAYEKSVLNRCLLNQVRLLETTVFEGLSGPSVACPPLVENLQAESAMVAKASVYNGMHFEVGDMVLLPLGGAGFVKACAIVDDESVLLVGPMALVERPTQTSSRWREQPGLQIWLLSNAAVTQAYSWTIEGDVVLALHR